MGDEIRSMEEYERKYFPGKIEEREFEEALKDPKKFGELLAKQTLEQLRDLLEKVE